MKGFLVFTDQQGQIVNETEIRKLPLLIGREAPCDIIIAVGSISRVHAEIFERDQELWIMDKGSSNGIEINGQKVNEGQLEELHSIKVGDLQLEFRSPSFEERTFIATKKEIRLDDYKKPQPDFSESTAIVKKSEVMDDVFDAKTVIRPLNSPNEKFGPGTPAGPPHASIKAPSSTHFTFDLQLPEFQKPKSSPLQSLTPQVPVQQEPKPVAPPQSAPVLPNQKPTSAMPEPRAARVPNQPLPQGPPPADHRHEQPNYQPLPEEVSLADMRESMVGKQMPEKLVQASYKGPVAPQEYLVVEEPRNEVRRWLPVLALSAAVGVAAYVFLVKGSFKKDFFDKATSTDLSSNESNSKGTSKPSGITAKSLDSVIKQIDESYQKTQSEIRWNK